MRAFLEKVSAHERPLLWVLALAPMVALLGAFWRTDLTSWDMVGHVALAIHYRDHLWPAFQGWNGIDGFGGFPQGTFYASLFEWTVGGLGRIVPLGLAFRACLAVGVLLLPISLFVFLREWGIGPRQAFTGVFLALSALLLANPLSLGGFFTSTFRGGLVSAQWSLPLVFFHAALLRRCLAPTETTARAWSRRWPWIVAAGAVLGLLVVSHIVNTIAAFLLSVSLLPLACKSWRRAPRVLVPYVLHGLVALALAAFWLEPFLVNRHWASGHAVASFPLLMRTRRGLWLYVPAAATCLAAIVSRVRRKPVGSAALLVPLLVLLGTYGVLEGLGLLGTFAHLAVHPYRLLVFAFIFMALLAGEVIASLRFGRVALWASVAVYVGSAVFFTGRYFRVVERQVQDAGIPVAVDARGLVNEDRDSLIVHASSPHLVAFVLQRAGMHVMNGVFVESSAVSPYVTGLTKELDARAYLGNAEPVAMDPRRAPFDAWALGVQWVLSATALPVLDATRTMSRETLNMRLVTNLGDEPVPQYLYRTPFQVVDLLESPPRLPNAATAWTALVDAWWTSGVVGTDVPVRADALPAPFEPARSSDRATLAETAFDRYRVDIASDAPRWALIKVPYFPAWHAFQDGHEIPLYEASVHMMAVYAKGPVDLVWVRSALDIACTRASQIAWLGVIIALLVAMWRRRASRGMVRTT